MAEKTLQALTSNAARLGQRLGENLAEHSRDLGLIDSFASGSGGGSGKYLENGAVITSAGIDETKRMLGSKREVDKMDGLKRVVAMMTKSLPVHVFFPLVTALLNPTTPLQFRSLISLYIIHCASTSPSLALLSINAYQKDLSDPNPIVRAGAIQTLSEMGLDDIRSLVGVAVNKGARDSSWYVRRSTANALVALFKQNSSSRENLDSLKPTLIVLLDTATPLTIGSALQCWEELTPNNWDFIHRNYRKWCKMLMDVEEWGQCELLRVLGRYGRTFMLDPVRTGKVDEDVELLLRSSEALLQHLNPSVVAATVRVHYYLTPPDRHRKIVRPLLRLLNSPKEIQGVVLQDCLVVAEERPELLVHHVPQFFVRLNDEQSTKKVKLLILVALATQSNVSLLLKEFLIYVQDPDEAFSAEAIAAIGTCANRVPAVAGEALKTLIKLSQGKSDLIIGQAVLVLRSLLRSKTFPSTVSRSAIITKLVALLEAGKIKTATARANVYWLVGQYASEGLVESVGPDAVRMGAKGFAEESAPAKLQLLTLSAKLLVLSHISPVTPHFRPLSLLFTYLTTIARYDLTYEVRDRARFLKGLLSSAGVGVPRAGEGAKMTLGEDDFAKGVQVEENGDGTSAGDADKQTMTAEQVRRSLFEGKEDGVVDERSAPGELGTFALLLPGRRLAFTSLLPPYPATVPPSSIRDVASVDSLKAPTASSFSNSRPSTPMQGFGSDSRPGRSGKASPVVLVPTHFAGGADSHEGSRSASPMTGAAGRKAGFVDLENFYDDEESNEGEESDEDEESEEEEAEEEDEDEEEEEGEGSSEVSGDDEDEVSGAEEGIAQVKT